MVQGKLLRIIRELYHLSPLRKYFFYRYNYMFSPQQLFLFCDSIKKTSELNGSIVEIGCAEGRSTVFVQKYMQSENIEKRYICIDTFSGFTKEDVNYEDKLRNKNKKVLKTQFVANKRKWVDATLKYNGINNVELYEADINTFNFDDHKIDKISLCLVDVDLYLPVLSALNKIFDRMEKGGIIIVDDCRQDEYYDGALQAYNEFIESKNIKSNIVLEKLGLIIKD